MEGLDEKTVMLSFANALSYMLKDDEGIVCQAEMSDKQIHKFIVFRKDGKIVALRADDFSEPLGKKIMVSLYDDKEEALLEAARKGEGVYLPEIKDYRECPKCKTKIPYSVGLNKIARKPIVCPSCGWTNLPK